MAKEMDPEKLKVSWAPDSVWLSCMSKSCDRSCVWIHQCSCSWPPHFFSLLLTRVLHLLSVFDFGSLGKIWFGEKECCFISFFFFNLQTSYSHSLISQMRKRTLSLHGWGCCVHGWTQVSLETEGRLCWWIVWRSGRVCKDQENWYTLHWWRGWISTWQNTKYAASITNRKMKV